VNTDTQHFRKTRIAPTPSGFLHLGNVYSFALTAALAEKHTARTLLRIDDLDRDRVNKEYIQDIFDTLNFLEIPWDEGPKNYKEYQNEYSQLHRVELYQNALDELAESNSLFACTCSRSQIRVNSADEVYPGTCRHKNLSLDARDASWRLKTDEKLGLSVKTLKDGTIRTLLPAAMKDFVIKKKDGNAAYQLASLIDDLHFEVDLIVRGKDLWNSTLAQLYLSQKLGANEFQKSTFHHHALLTESAGIKLSKSAGDTSIRYLRQLGCKPADIYSKIGRMLGSKENIDTRQQLAALAFHLS
jgi:glutamyl/glutaminyl-tRNA synthetase